MCLISYSEFNVIYFTLGILGGTVTATGMGQCREDQFFVTNPGGPSPPVICGIMTGEHSRFYF